MANPANEVYRCTATERGKQCVCEFTFANAFSYSMRTIIARNQGEVTWGTVRRQVICPFHAKLLQKVRRDICKLEHIVGPVDQYRKELLMARSITRYDRTTTARKERQMVARMPAMAQAMRVAGVGTVWPRRP